MRARAVVLAAALILAPLGARAADLVVWWEKGYYAQEDEAVREIIAAFEQKTGKQVELVLHRRTRCQDKVQAALEAGPAARLPFGYCSSLDCDQWAYEDRLVDLADALGPLLGPVRSGRARLRHAAQRRRRPARPLRAADGARHNHVHVWKSLLEQAGFTLDDIPKEWEAFWSFWCDRSSRRCARPRAATTSGASGCRCRPRRPIPTISSSSSCRPTRPTTCSPRRPAHDRRPGDQARLIKAMDATPRSTARAAPRPTRSTGPTSTTTRRSWRRRS